MTPGLCGVCGKPGDLRPYGAGGSPICFPCMKAKPEREAEADRQINRLLDEQGRAGSVIAGTMVDFQRSGDLVQVEIRPHGNVETVKARSEEHTSELQSLRHLV